MQTSESVNEIAKALAKAQGEMKAPIKDKAGGFKDSKTGKAAMYSSIDAIWDCIQQVLPGNGLCVVQDLCSVENGITIETRVIHESGQWMSFGPFYLPTADKSLHKYASSSTYARRYSLCAALCVNGEFDDDGAEAQKEKTKKETQDESAIIDMYLDLIEDENFVNDIKNKLIKDRGLNGALIFYTKKAKEKLEAQNLSKSVGDNNGTS